MLVVILVALILVAETSTAFKAETVSPCILIVAAETLPVTVKSPPGGLAPRQVHVAVPGDGFRIYKLGLR